MFHELLLALNGLPGNIFFDSPDGIKLTSCIPNLHPAERSILEKLCGLGTKYKYLADFIKKHKFNSSKQGDIHGLYLKSFCFGMESILSIYQEDLIQIETEILRDPFLPLTHFLKLEKHSLLFQVLHSITNEIIKDKIHGCRILELLFIHSSCGDPVVEASINKILQHCNSVLFRQVFCWMMNGYIEDPYIEFFIQANIPTKVKSSINFHHNSAEKNLSVAEYSLKPDLLPSYIPSSLASKILSVGEYVSVLNSTEDSETYSLFLRNEELFAERIEKLLSSPMFSLISFETTIDDIRKCASERLWEVIAKGADVINHLKVIKDFYLLGRGELFLSFIIAADKLLQPIVTTTTEADSNKLFQIITRHMLPDDDIHAEKFQVVLQLHKNKSPGVVDKDSLSKVKLENGWSTIGLIYEVPHPLHILITPTVIDRYNAVFRFLLSVKKVQIDLHQCWALQMRNKELKVHSQVLPFWTLRSHMTFLIDNLQYYILVDVLESRFSNLLNKMEIVKDFEEIQQCHNTFLAEIVSQCFLELWTARHTLDEIFELCASFCGLFNRISTSPSPKDIAALQTAKASFQNQTSLLFKILSGVRSVQESPHLTQLLLRIDYNKYLSSCSGQLGGFSS